MNRQAVLYTGEDRRVLIDVKDQTGQAIDISAATDVIILLKAKPGRVFAQYTINSKSGYLDRISFTTDGTDGKLTLLIERAESVTFPPGDVVMDLGIALPDNDYPQDRVQIQQFIFKVITSQVRI